MRGGLEWVVDAYGCEADRLRSQAALRACLDEIVGRLELPVVGVPVLHEFTGRGGLMALYSLSDSHLAAHTFPESGFLSLNLYCRESREPFDWEVLLRRRFSAERVSVRELPRGSERA